MSSFDLSVVTALKEKFESISTSIEEKTQEIQLQEDELTNLESTIQELESKKLTIEMTRNHLKEEQQKLHQLYQESESQYNAVNQAAQQLLLLLNHE